MFKLSSNKKINASTVTPEINLVSILDKSRFLSLFCFLLVSFINDSNSFNDCVYSPFSNDESVVEVEVRFFKAALNN